ncbi:tRNA (adenosine(37)-N6)-threonylcarbamoyltransferase complex ATPase subunit type 1 TsaE [Roseicyclus sp. F158]|uniref:tRNA threonylcarbamoyladenosine biosynthesis protein TsaE n=1 Tax=Tropicimonas omnivorans TaxID=3075590 RepID=A0ABU3DD37_9RHOB|nr:tRNA (adenosine(37)-N6)-threonylcarbamoyltransferase complex ATPase subunit type 1 TsaE [Roseicyclus sp. F158]MDT0681463.1 tRNA (adenosine(37)-N6)-threonylcarbamoyltransferase complex ATPase subunit type 1 TsaE [Roseicyclus sp. F158]
MIAPAPSRTPQIALPDADATEALGRHLAALLQPGDTLLLDGPIGAGKSHLARAILHAMMAEEGGAIEDVPSPTYTLVQTYAVPRGEVWHADLYRLGDPSEVEELGLEAAMGRDICLVEWPDRLGGGPLGGSTLGVSISHDGEGRIVRLTPHGQRAQRIADTLAPESAQ